VVLTSLRRVVLGVVGLWVFLLVGGVLGHLRFMGVLRRHFGARVVVWLGAFLGVVVRLRLFRGWLFRVVPIRCLCLAVRVVLGLWLRFLGFRLAGAVFRVLVRDLRRSGRLPEVSPVRVGAFRRSFRRYWLGF
jgi:hypothetical protein